MMTSKERMMTALAMDKPDRLPATLHQWQPYHLQHYMGGLSDIEAFRNVGLDAAITFSPFEEVESAEWRVEERKKGDKYPRYEYEITTPEGTLSYSIETNEYTQWISDHLIKKDEDIYLYKKFAPSFVLDKKTLEAKYREVGEAGIVRMFIIGRQGGCWQDACELYGTSNMILSAIDKPNWVHEFLTILLNKKLSFIDDQMKNAKVDLVETGGGASSTTVISPQIHKEFCLPYDRKIHRALHTVGHKVVYHTCGGMMALLDIIPKNECDASETLSPPGVGGDIVNPREVKKRLGNKVPIIGGLDQFNILESGKPEIIRKEVFHLFEGFGEGGGYIMSASDHFFKTPRENLLAYADAAKECVYS